MDAELVRRAPLEFIRLMSQVTPSGGLCVRLHGAPRSDAEIMLRDAIARSAAQCRAHVQTGASILDVHFSRGPTSCVGPHARIHLDTRTDDDIVRRVYIMASMVILILLLLILIHFKGPRTCGTS
jgi:hypothetical protein